ncbi:DUF6226 family protein [Lentzea sp. DG1S-22]|uniref:DUF6226 family protein n=1 Tax=Lentzea sp. DG1S-22 TaxID=3108822 RepID=UPI002E783111|nr:DUF6226 family protein [Lentzea sp. DG1S-22]WVH83669.1 DUF6226 family protein [Lentzea sp. DG1S-22]
MATVDEVLAEVAARYRTREPRSWPAPRPAGESPREEEYSRLTDPDRYRVVHLRSRAWADTLVARADAVIAPVPSYPTSENHTSGRGARLASRRPGTLPLFLLEHDVRQAGGAPLPALDIAVAEPGNVVASHPDCGCDACDTGSAGLLEAIDRTMTAVVAGPYVSMRAAEGWFARWHPQGCEISGTGPGLRDVARLCERLVEDENTPLPEGVVAHVGRSWLH